MKFFQAAIITALAVPTAAINEPVVSPTVAINDNEPIVSPTAAKHVDAQIDRDRELENESQNTVALLEASIQENMEDVPDVVLVQQLQMAESQVRPMLMPCRYGPIMHEIEGKAFDSHGEATLAESQVVQFNLNDRLYLAEKQGRPMLMPCQVPFETEQAELVLLDPNVKPANEVVLVVEEVIDQENVIDSVELPSVEDVVVSNEDAIEIEGSQQQGEAPIIINRPREPEAATTMTSNAKASKSPSPASTKTSKEPKAATMAVVDETFVEESEFSEAVEDLDALVTDYEEVGVETAESEEEEDEN